MKCQALQDDIYHDAYCQHRPPEAVRLGAVGPVVITQEHLQTVEGWQGSGTPCQADRPLAHVASILVRHFLFMNFLRLTPNLHPFFWSVDLLAHMSVTFRSLSPTGR